MKHHKTLRAAALAVLAALILSLAACGAPENADPTSQPAPSSSSDSEDSAPPAAGGAGSSAADGTAQDDGGLFQGSMVLLPFSPTALLPLPNGNALLADQTNRSVYCLETDGDLTLYAGDITEAVDVNGRPLGGYADGPDTESLFALPWAIAPFLDGYAVSDAENNALRLIQDGQVSTLNVTGTGGTPLNYPTGLAAGEDGCLYFSDTGNGRVCRVTTDGRMAPVAKGLSEPMGLSWHDGVLYIAETGANRILQLSDGKLTVLAGQGADGCEDGKADQALFCAPRGVVAAEGCVYVADTANSAVRRIKDGVVDTLIRHEVSDEQNPLPASPTGLSLWEGDLYVCDTFTGALLKLPVEE